MEMSTDIKTNMGARSLEVHPRGLMHIKLKSHNDHISYNKCTTKVHNILFGSMYIEHLGDMIYLNHTTNDRAVLTL